jgi:hypothetical protein
LTAMVAGAAVVVVSTACSPTMLVSTAATQDNDTNSHEDVFMRPVASLFDGTSATVRVTP